MTRRLAIFTGNGNRVVQLDAPRVLLSNGKSKWWIKSCGLTFEVREAADGEYDAEQAETIRRNLMELEV
jgi:hypothetical protein